MTSPARIGLVGLGRWGRNILRDLVALDADVTVVDPEPEAREAADAAGAANGVSRLDQCTEQDGWIVATPATTHVAVLDELLALSDRPIYCEKPFTTDRADAERLVGEAGDRIHVMHVWRHHPGIGLLAELASSGALGEINGVRSTRANWTSPRTDTDSFWTMMPHDLTIGLEILGSVPVAHAAVAEMIDDRVVGVWASCGATSALAAGNRSPWLLIEASNRFGDRRREVRVHGTEGVAVLSDDAASAVRIERGSGLEAEVEERPVTGDGTALERELKAFLVHLDGGPAPKSSAAEALVVVERVTELRALAGLAPDQDAPR